MEVSQKPAQSAAYLIDRHAAEVASLLNEKVIDLLYGDARHGTAIIVCSTSLQKRAQMAPLAFHRFLTDCSVIAEKTQILGQYRWI